MKKKLIIGCVGALLTALGTVMTLVSDCMSVDAIEDKEDSEEE